MFSFIIFFFFFCNLSFLLLFAFILFCSKLKVQGEQEPVHYVYHSAQRMLGIWLLDEWIKEPQVFKVWISPWFRQVRNSHLGGVRVCNSEIKHHSRVISVTEVPKPTGCLAGSVGKVGNLWPQGCEYEPRAGCGHYLQIKLKNKLKKWNSPALCSSKLVELDHIAVRKLPWSQKLVLPLMKRDLLIFICKYKDITIRNKKS